MGVSILVVDDESDVAELFRQRFRREARRGVVELYFAGSGADALSLLERTFEAPPEYLLADVNMPGMSGIELVAEAKARWPGMQAIMITAYGDEDTRSRAQEAGADGFLTKPVDFGALKTELIAD